MRLFCGVFMTWWREIIQYLADEVPEMPTRITVWLQFLLFSLHFCPLSSVHTINRTARCRGVFHWNESERVVRTCWMYPHNVKCHQHHRHHNRRRRDVSPPPRTTSTLRITARIRNVKRIRSTHKHTAHTFAFKRSSCAHLTPFYFPFLLFSLDLLLSFSGFSSHRQRALSGREFQHAPDFLANSICVWHSSSLSPQTTRTHEYMHTFSFSIGQEHTT